MAKTEILKEVRELRQLVEDMRQLVADLAASCPVFVPLDPAHSLTAQGLHTIQLPCPFQHIVPVPQMGGAVIAIESTPDQQAQGVLRIRFAGATRLRGVLVLPPQDRADAN